MKNISVQLILLLVWLPAITLSAQTTDTHLPSFVKEEVSINKPDDPTIADPVNIALDHIKSHLHEYGLSTSDITEMTIQDMYTDHNSGITRIYFLQHYKGIPVHNAILNINIDKTGKVFYSGNRFVQGLEEMVNTQMPEVSPREALNNLATHLGLSAPALRMKAGAKDFQYVFEKGDLASEDIPVKLVYQPFGEKIMLAYDILLAPLGSTDKWNTRVDAIDGKILDETNWTVYCFRQDTSQPGGDATCTENHNHLELQSNPNVTTPLYHVWPAPIESPNHGPRLLVPAPVDTLASPYGWHDTNGSAGAEYNITRGNNVHAFQDRQGNGTTSNDEPDGGTNLYFDFPFDPSLEPDQYVDAAVVNLFYWINYMHDFSYHFGFDESAGNFQQNNYGKGGLGADQIRAKTQEGAEIGHENNAYYVHANEGAIPTISMYVFKNTKNFLTVNEPAAVAGRFKTSHPSEGWGVGAYVTDVPVSGELVLVNDGIENPYTSDACEPILNTSALAGKIALLDRGGCEFGWKALQAQNAGAIAVLCINIDDDMYTMNKGTYGDQVQIPILMIGQSDYQTISSYVGNGLHVTLVDPGQDIPVALDSDLDNTIIAHEYGHGISCRLVGGPSTNCLNNVERMSEGWSDFFALVTTVLPGDTGEKKRGFGTYANKDIPSGKGFRRYPYSTDMSIMPLTYGDVAPNPEIHNLGEVWAAALWDMYWAFVDRYGWSANAFDTTSGNYKAIRLVFDGLKNTPCSPGFVDGRNAILAADESLFNGEHFCMIWEVFARRGIGYSADQGSPFDAGDQKEAFDLPPVCTNKMTIGKTVTGFIQPGEDILVTIKAGNFKNEPVANVVVTDEIPAGTNFKLNSSNLPADLQGNKITFHVGDMQFKDELTITYMLETNADEWSKRKFLDDVADEANMNWLAYSMGGEAPNVWTITNNHPAHTGDYVWNSQEIPQKARQALELNPAVHQIHVDGAHPALRFYHRYKTKAGTNGGIVEIKEASEEKWHQVGDDMLRNGYSGYIDYLSFIAPNLSAFSGNSGDAFRATYVDLSKWSGKDINIRFRFGTSSNTATGMGWLIDDIEYMDLLAYNSEVCLVSDQGDFECAIAPEHGTIVESKEEATSAAPEVKLLDGRIYPNPATNMVMIELPIENQEEGEIEIRTIEGKIIHSETFTLAGHKPILLNTTNVPSGMYIVNVHTVSGRFIGRVIIL